MACGKSLSRCSDFPLLLCVSLSLVHFIALYARPLAVSLSSLLVRRLSSTSFSPDSFVRLCRRFIKHDMT